MRIAIISQVFHPSVGGIETVTESLALGLYRLGHSVTVITRTPSATVDHRDFAIVRNPGPLQLLKALYACDVVLHNNIVSRMLWASVLLCRPTVIAHHTWIKAGEKSISGQERVKLWMARRFKTIAVSRIVCDSLNWPTEVIPNSYDPCIFWQEADRMPSKQLLFVGRLVSDKGCDLFINSLSLLREQDPSAFTSATIIGDGPERVRLEALADAHELTGCVEFQGSRPPEHIAQEMRDHRVVVVPSRWREPFGIVALEAAASGCLVVVPTDTGLVEAAGPSAVPYTRNDVEALKAALHDSLVSPREIRGLASHLVRHAPTQQARAYEGVLSSVARCDSHYAESGFSDG